MDREGAVVSVMFTRLCSRLWLLRATSRRQARMNRLRQKRTSNSLAISSEPANFSNRSPRSHCYRQPQPPQSSQSWLFCRVIDHADSLSRASIVRAHIGDEPVHDTQATAALRRSFFPPRSPPNRQFCCNNASALLFDETNEISRQKFRLLKPVSKLSAKPFLIGH